MIVSTVLWGCHTVYAETNALEECADSMFGTEVSGFRKWHGYMGGLLGDYKTLGKYPNSGKWETQVVQ
jgi:hypothetical protein